jgi:glycine reductase
MEEKIRIVHYLNQFFAQIGGEEKGSVAPGVKPGPIGPGRALQSSLGNRGEVVATIFCGDNHYAEHPEDATEILLGYISQYEPDLFIAGPAFESGRYGVACGAICHAVQERLGIPVVAGMDRHNAGATLYHKSIFIIDSGASVIRMTAVLQHMIAFGLGRLEGAALGKPEIEGYIARGTKRNEIAPKPPAERAVDMLLAKIHGKSFETEISAPKFNQGRPAASIANLSTATIALVTDGGLVPEGNPEQMEPGRPTRFTTIDIRGVERLDAEEFDAVHSGYDTQYANRDPHRLVPLDVMRELERQRVFGKLYETIYSTGGAHAAVENATRIGQDIAGRLKEAGVQGAILTST